MSATVRPLAKSAATLILLCPRRSASAPPKIDATAVGNAVTNAVSPVLAALPVVANTNQGTAMAVMTLPTSEHAFATCKPRNGDRRRRGLDAGTPTDLRYGSNTASTGRSAGRED